jgi:hypothetical protein
VKLREIENNQVLFVDLTISGYSFSSHSTLRTALFKSLEFAGNQNQKLQKDMIKATMKQKESMVNNDNKKDCQISCMVNILPSLQSIMNEAANRHFKEKQFGRAKWFFC